MSVPDRPAAAIACSSTSWGGLEMQAVLSAEELAARGRRMIFLCSPGTQIQKEAESRGIETKPILSRRYFDPRAVARIAKLLRQAGAGIVHAESSRDLWQVVPAARLAGTIPTLLTQRMASSVNKKDPVHTWLYKNTARVIAISRMVEENLKKRTAIPHDRIVRIHNGVDLKLFDAVRGSREGVRHELGIPVDAPVAALVGRIAQGKGHRVFLAAAARIAQQIPSARFMVIGGPAHGEEDFHRRFLRLAEGSPVAGRITFTGHRDDIPRLLMSADLLVAPSESEALGNVAIEGMAASLPVAAADGAGFLDIVVDGETGRLFPPRSVPALVTIMEELLRDKCLAGKMGAAGRRHVEEHFNRARRTDAIEALYEKVTHERNQ